MLNFDPKTYGPAVAELLEPEPLCELGPGRPNSSSRERLRSLNPAAIFAGATVVDQPMADCCLAGLWLLHNFLDESHALSQEIETPTGSYWHGIMHRREPDFGNAKYWFRRVGTHPVFGPLQEETRQILLTTSSENNLAPAQFLADQTAWDPYAFIDLCEAAQKGGPLDGLCRRVAQAEWRLLFDFCYRRSIGTWPSNSPAPKGTS